MSYSLHDLPAQIASKIELCPLKGCWLWTGSTSGTGRGGGYGRLTWRGATWATHKLVWLLSGGRLLRQREQLDHECRVRRCCNPAHLKPMFQRRNMLLAHSRKRAAFVAEAVR